VPSIERFAPPDGHPTFRGILKFVVPEIGGRIVGRYEVWGEIASGGMASVHFGRLVGPIGFSRIVALKCLHPHFAKDAEFVAMFVDEARVASRIHHPNVVPILDVVSTEGELFLVMEYVPGEALSRLLKAVHAQGARVPPPIASTILAGVLHGLHAAHDAKNERGEPLDVVHRDVSPQNILVGLDGASRVLDFGVAKAVGRLQMTHEGQMKGKLAYMSPEQARGRPVDRTTDVYAAAVVLWEVLTGHRLFQADDPQTLISKVLTETAPAPSKIAPELPRAADQVVLRGLAREPGDRFPTALEMAAALESAIPRASPRELGQWVEANAREQLRARADLVRRIEGGDGSQASGVRNSLIRRSPSSPETGAQAPVVGVEGAPPPNHAETSQVSHLSVSSASSSPRRASWRWWSVAGVCVFAAGAYSLVVARQKGEAQRAPAPAAIPAASDSPSAFPVASSSAEPPPLAPPSALPLPLPVPSGSSPPASKAAPSRKNRPPRTRPDSCDTPFTVDSQGFRHPRPECLHLTPVSP
jgi:serine/threonine-protein kinase